MAGNPWDNDPIIGRATPPARPLPSPPKPVDTTSPAEAERLRIEQERLRLAQQQAGASDAKDAIEIKGKQDKLNSAKADAIGSITTVLDKLDQVGFDSADNNGWFETGRTGAMMRGLPKAVSAGTAAYDLKANLATIDANTAFNALQRMRENSPTGGAVGNVSDTDMALLKSTIANLDPDQSQEQFFANLAEAKKRYLELLDRLDPAAAEAARKKPGIQWDKEGRALLVSLPGDTRDRIDPMGVDRPAGPPDGGAPPPPDGGKDDSFWRMPTSWEQAKEGLGGGAGDLVEGALNSTVGLVTNPIATTIGRAAGYEDYNADLGTDVRKTIGLPDNPDPLSSAINQGGIAAMTGGGLARGVSSLFRPGTTARGITQMLGSNPVRDAVAGAAGSGSAEVAREQGAGVPGQLLAGLAGGVAGYGAAGLPARLMTPKVATPIAAAAERQGIDLLPADVGGPATRMASAVTDKTLGGIPMAEGAQRSVASAGAARDRVASSIGRVADDAGAGQAAKRGAQDFINKSERRGGDLFEKIPVPNDREAVSDNTRKTLSELTQGMKSNPELSKIWTDNPRLKATLDALTPTDNSEQGRRAMKEASDRLMEAHTKYENLANSVMKRPEDMAGARDAVTKAQQDLRRAEQMANSEPSGGTISWEDMKRLRSIVGEIVGQPGLAAEGNQVSALRKFYGALSSDMEATAAATSPRALTEFRRANQYWRGRESRINEVLSGILGNNLNKGDEAAFEQINRWAQAKGGDSARLAQAMRSLPAEEAATVRASVLGRLGNASPGRQNADGLQFSPAEFATQWNKLSPRAKSTLFPEKEHRQSINDLALVMDGMKRAGQYANTSGTVLGINASAHSAGLMSYPFTTSAIAFSELVLGSLLSSPTFARWLARSREVQPKAMANYIEKLGPIAARTPIIATDVQALQQHLRETFASSPLRAAAGQKEEDGRREPVQ